MLTFRRELSRRIALAPGTLPGPRWRRWDLFELARLEPRERRPRVSPHAVHVVPRYSPRPKRRSRLTPCRARSVGVFRTAPRTRSLHTPRRAGARVRRCGNPQCSPPDRARARAARVASDRARPSAAPARERARPSAVRGPVESPPCKRHRPFNGAGSPGLHTAAALHGRPSRHFAPQRGRSSVGGRLRATRTRSATPATVALTASSRAAMPPSSARSTHGSHSPHEHGALAFNELASAITSSDCASHRASRSAVFRSNARRRFIVGGRFLTVSPSAAHYPMPRALARRRGNP